MVSVFFISIIHQPGALEHDRGDLTFAESGTEKIVHEMVDFCILTGAKFSHFGDGLYTTHKKW